MTGASKAMARVWILLPLLLAPDSCEPSCYGSLRSIATPATQVAAPWMTGRWVALGEDGQRTPGEWDLEIWAWRDTEDLTVWLRDEDQAVVRTQEGSPEGTVGLRARLVQSRRLQLVEVIVDRELVPHYDMTSGFIPVHTWFRLSGSRDSMVLEWLDGDFVDGRLARRQNRLPHTRLDDGALVLTGDASQLWTFLEEAFALASTPPESLSARVDSITLVRAVPAPAGPDSQAVGR
jgi:hypothetical protein